MTTETTPGLGLNFGYVTGESGWGDGVNANWMLLDAVAVPFAKSSSVTVPPATAADGDRYLVPAGATGVWSSHAGKLATWFQTQWVYFTPRAGWYQRVWDTRTTYVYDGSAWMVFLDSVTPAVMAQINGAIAAAESAGDDATATAADRLATHTDMLTAQGARDGAVVAQSVVATDRGLAQDARNAAIAAQEAAEGDRASVALSTQTAVYAAAAVAGSGEFRNQAAASAVIASNQSVIAGTKAGEALASQVITVAQAGIATAQAGIATTAKVDAQTAKTAAEAARDAAHLSAGVYAATAAGLAATTSGRYFSVPSADANQYLILYENVAGTATERKRYPSAASVPQYQPDSETGLSFAVVDDVGRRTWIEANLEGHPSDWAASRIGEKLNGSNTPALVSAAQQSISNENDLSISFVDMNDARTELECGADGRLTQRVIDSIRSRLSLGQASSAITCLGDSLTAGAGGTPYPTYLTTLTGRIVTNLGVGGEDSRTITARFGARPMRATVTGGSIPTTGGVTVTLAGDDGTVSPLLQGSAGVNPVKIAGITGTLSLASSVYTFTRTASGAAVPVNFPVPVITMASTTYRSDILVIEMGQNDATNDATDVINRANACIQFMTGADKRWLVSGLSTVNAEYRSPMELQFLRAFGRRFVNIREYLSSAAAMSDAGLTPTSTDLTQMGVGQVPESLRSDATHLNSAGYARKAACVHARLLELGFIT